MSKTDVNMVNTVCSRVYVKESRVNTVCSRVYVKESRWRCVFPSCIHKVKSVEEHSVLNTCVDKVNTVCQRAVSIR